MVSCDTEMAMRNWRDQEVNEEDSCELDLGEQIEVW